MGNERLNGLLAYLDRLIALEVSGYKCSREIGECITAIREGLALIPPKESGITLNPGDRMSVKFEGTTESLYVEGPAKVVIDESAGERRSFEQRLYSKLAESE